MFHILRLSASQHSGYQLSYQTEELRLLWLASLRIWFVIDTIAPTGSASLSSPGLVTQKKYFHHSCKMWGISAGKIWGHVFVIRKIFWRSPEATNIFLTPLMTIHNTDLVNNQIWVSIVNSLVWRNSLWRDEAGVRRIWRESQYFKSIPSRSEKDIMNSGPVHR